MVCVIGREYEWVRALEQASDPPSVAECQGEFLNRASRSVCATSASERAERPTNQPSEMADPLLDLLAAPADVLFQQARFYLMTDCWIFCWRAFFSCCSLWLLKDSTQGCRPEPRLPWLLPPWGTLSRPSWSCSHNTQTTRPALSHQWSTTQTTQIQVSTRFCFLYCARAPKIRLYMGLTKFGLFFVSFQLATR